MATCARALIFDTKGNVLLGLEAHSKEYGLAGGHRRDQEHLVDTLLREVHEETKLGPHFRHFEYLRDYLDNAIFLVIVDPPPATPNPSQDPDCEFLSFIWCDPANLPDSVSEFASDVLFNYLCGMVGRTTASINNLEEAIEEFKDSQASYVGFTKMTDSVAQELRDDLERADQRTIYRCISFRDKEAFLKGLQSHGTGVFWTYDRDKAVCYWGDKEDQYYGILTGIAGESIDWSGTVEQHMRPSTSGEAEVRLLPHKPIKVVEVEIFNRASKDSTIIPINKILKTGSRDQNREEPPAQLSASLSLEGTIREIVHYYFDNYFNAECPKILVTTTTTSEPWLAKTEKSDRGIELIVNREIAKVPRILKQAVAHESIHILLYSQDDSGDPHGEKFDKWAEIINSDEGPNYVGKTAEQTSF